MRRDKTIDHLRGFAMLWVIVVHVLYWGNFFLNDYFNLLKSFCLFEMPLFFFVTGASNGFSKINGYLDFVYKRYKRILLPYWVFASICAALSIATYGIGGIDFISAVKILLSWLLPLDRQMTTIPILNYAVWFVPVYLCVVLIIPGLKKLHSSKHRILFAFLLLGVFVATCLLQLGWVQNVAFYSFWTYIGLFYREIKYAALQKNCRKYFLYIAAIGMVLVFALAYSGWTLDMQINKFPPNIIFLAFSMIMMAMIMLMLPCLDCFCEWIKKCKLADRIFTLYSTRSLTIFLYQVFPFYFAIRCTKLLIGSQSMIASIAKAMLCFMATVLLCAGFAVLFGWVEGVGNRKQRRCK